MQRISAFCFFRRWVLSWKTTAVLFLYRQMMTDPNEKKKKKLDDQGLILDAYFKGSLNGTAGFLILMYGKYFNTLFWHRYAFVLL